MRFIGRIALFLALLSAALPSLSAMATPRCSDEQSSFDIAVVLGGGITSQAQLEPDSATRVAAGVALYHAGLVSRLHMTGGGGAKGLTIGAVMARDAIAAGVPAGRVTHEGLSQSTLQNALFSKPFLPRDATLVVVTEPFHSWRGAASFYWAGRPAGFCASAQAERSAALWTRTRLRESLAWPFNVARAAYWSASQALPQGWRPKMGLLD